MQIEFDMQYNNKKAYKKICMHLYFLNLDRINANAIVRGIQSHSMQSLEAKLPVWGRKSPTKLRGLGAPYNIVLVKILIL